MITAFKKYYIFVFAVIFIVGASLIIPEQERIISNDDRLIKVIESLGGDVPDHFPNTSIFGVSAKRGKSLVVDGISTKPGGGKTKKQSKHFVCTSCHNLEREDPDLRFPDPQARLEYTNAKGMPFLQGTSLYGAVNREEFYNDDYYKKYGDLVIAARNNIREAIQLCAVECAQGRKLKDWELESVLAYLWTIDLKVSDLNLDDAQLDFIDGALKSSTQRDSALNLINSRYLKRSPAHFGTAEDSRMKSKELVGNPDNGKLVYDNSCLHCHQDRRYSYFNLDDCDLTFKYLKKKSGTYGDHSIYQAVRYGIHSISGRRSYMPQYPLEKLSEQQLLDLKSYIDQRAE